MEQDNQRRSVLYEIPVAGDVRTVARRHPYACDMQGGPLIAVSIQ